MYKEFVISKDSAVGDGENVYQSYRLVKLSEIRGLRFKVNI